MILSEETEAGVFPRLLVVNVKQSLLDCGGDGLGPVRDLQLLNDVVHVISGGIGADLKSRADLLVGETLGHHLEDLPLAGGEVGARHPVGKP